MSATEVRFCRRTSRYCAIATGLLALLTLLAWITGTPVVARWHISSHPMSLSAAAASFLLATGLWSFSFSKRAVSLTLGAAAALLPLVLLGMDGARPMLPGDVAQLRFGGAERLSPITAAVMTLGGLAIVTLAAPVACRQLHRLAGGLAVVMAAAGGVFLLGYLYGTPLLYGGPVIPVALPAATACLLLGVGLLAAAGPHTWPTRLLTGTSVGARLSRALLPVLLLLIIVINWVSLRLLHMGLNPALDVALRSLVAIGVVSVIIVCISRGVGRDIEQANASLRASDERFRLFYENSPTPFHSLDSHGRFVEVNQAFLRTLGYTREEIIGRSVTDLLTDASRQRFAELFPRYKQEGHVENLEYAFIRKDGSHITVTLSARLEKTPQGEFLRDYCVWSDITNQHQAQLAMAQAKSSAEAANQAKDHLLATVSHELRTPLTPVLVTLSMLEEDSQVPAKLRSDITMMRGRIEAEAKLIDGLLDLTRMTRGKVRLKPEVVDVHALLEHAIAMAVKDADAYRPTIRRELKARRYCVWADATRLQQVCWNVIKNALQHTPDEGSLYIRSRNTADDKLELEFTDTGAGISPDFLPRIFNEFERGPGASLRRSSGLGLGLSIAKSLTEQLGGSIEASSEGLGKGATFILRLPLAAPAVQSAPTPTVPVLRVNPPASLHILLVEDDAETATSLLRVLDVLGYRVTGAHSVHEAIAAGQSQTFDLLVSDIGLPDGSGIEVMRWFAEHRGIPGIALSGYAAAADVERSQDAGFAMHLIKPIAIGALRAALQEVQRQPRT